MLPFPIASSQTDANSPVDDNLMDSIRLDLNYLDASVSSGGVPVYPWTITGKLNYLSGRIAKRIDMQFLHVLQTFSSVRLAQEKSGISGVTEIDIRYHTTPKTPITGIDFQFSDNTTSIALLGSTIATQAISVATAAVNTQSITRAEATRTVQSIINVGGSSWRYNLITLANANWSVGDTILVAGCTSAGNNGTFVITDVNHSGFPSIVVSNVSGVAQVGILGSLDLQIFSYNYINPVNDSFVAGESMIFANHTSALNNGTRTIYAINQGGNNIWVKRTTSVIQAGVLGTAACARWIYTYSAAVPVRFVIGEIARFATHTAPANNGDFLIVAINSAGNNITIRNVSGVTQGGAAGTSAALRWKYSFAGDPSTQVSIGDTLIMAGHTNGNNNGTFTVVALNDTVANNIIIYNALGVAQVSTPGTVSSTRKLIKFASDQSLIYSTNSYIEMLDCPDNTYNENNYTLPYKVLQVNRGGGANYNVVISSVSGLLQSSPAGFVSIEAKSIFTAEDGSKPQLSTDLAGLTPNGLLAVTSTAISLVAVPAQTYLGLYILQVQDGGENLSVMLA